MKQDILFLDANILFSAAYRENAGLLKFWHLKTVKLVSSAYAIEEARRNLTLIEQRERLEKLLISVENHPYHPENMELPKNITIKEKDIPILLAAISIKADYLITGDVKDFGEFYGKNISGVIILPPSEYLHKIPQG
ncbi:MAG: DNA-binding protein [Alphaproteobacteria bacterium]|nr:DNA-binding protein [Alphaproteobacteria bacterium]